MQAFERVLEYWFGHDGKARNELWFEQNDAVDAEIRERFGEDLERARRGLEGDWAATSRGFLALIIVLDQFSRNLYRANPLAYSCDPKAQELCTSGLERGIDRDLSVLERWFFYMPLMHAEDRKLQELGVRCFERLCSEAPFELEQACIGALDYARRHRDVIARFGRFPHRNAILGRDSTLEEMEFLKHNKPF